VRSQHRQVLDLPNIALGFRFSIDHVARGVFSFLDRRDCWVPPETSVAYFDALTAPSKKLVWFEQSGHEPFVDEPAKFNRALKAARHFQLTGVNVLGESG
jgi:pimeloyl-ACP methyl ester carboxylesterase